MKNKFLLILVLFFVSKIYANGIQIVEPLDNFNSPSFDVTFKWNYVNSQSTYILQTSLDPNFNTIDNVITTNNSEYTLNFTTTTTKIYWKVITLGNNGYMSSNIYTLNFINPSQFSDIVMWLDANKGTALQPDSTIDTWDNLVVGAAAAIQVNVTQRPKLISNICLLNNKNIVRFDGNDYMSINTGGNVMSAYAIFNFTGGTFFPDYNALLTVNNGISFNNYLYTFIAGSTTFETNGYFKGNTYVNKVKTFNVSPLSSYKLVAGFRSPLSVVSAPNFFIGTEAGSRFWKGDVAEIILSSNPNTNFGESDSIHNYLYNKYAPPITVKDIIVNTNFCDLTTITVPSCYNEYLWSTGETTQTISVTPNNKYAITVKNVFGIESTTSFNVYPYRRLDNATIYLCQGDTFKLNLNTPAGFTALWNTGANTTNLNITQAGQYTVKITDNNSCFVYDTINVIIDNPTLLPVPDANDSIRMCMNEKLFLQTATAFDSIQWSNGSNNNFITVNTPGNYTVYGRTTTGCVINKTVKVKINGTAPAANFTNTAFCEQTATNFTDISTAVNGAVVNQWKWTFGNNNSSILQNPTNVYTTTGSYTIGFKVTTNEGCSDSISRNIVVNKRPSANFYNLLSCSGLPTTFVDQSLANAASFNNWNWDFNGLGNSTNIQNPSFQFPTAGTYNVKLTVTNSNLCQDTITLPTAVKPSPTANFTFDSACGTNAINFQFLGTVLAPSTITSHLWDFGDGTLESTIRNAQKSYASPGTYSVKLTVRSSDQCSNTVEKQVKVFDFPIVDFDVSPTQCIGKEIQFSDISYTPDGTPLSNWNWYFAGQSTSTQQNPAYTFNQQGNYTVQLTAKNAVGCAGIKLRSIAVSEAPIPAFTFSPQNGLPPLTVSYFNQSPTNGNYVWDFGDGTATYSGYSPPAHVYNTIGTYLIKLTATNFRGCTDTLVKHILVDRASIDAVLTSVTITPVDDYYQVQITVVNNSNIQITALDLGIQVGSGTQIIESWTGSLLPNGTLTYIFTGKVKISDNAVPLVCATIESVNVNAVEDRIDNNSSCKELAVGNFDILNIFPNPAYDNINIGVMIPKDGKVNIKFIDMLGKVLYGAEFNGVRGYNAFNMTTMPLNAAVYVAEVTYDGQTVRKKFMRKDRK